MYISGKLWFYIKSHLWLLKVFQHFTDILMIMQNMTIQNNFTPASKTQNMEIWQEMMWILIMKIEETVTHFA